MKSRFNSKIKYLILIAASLLSIMSTAGCGNAIVLKNDSESGSASYYNGSNISGVTYNTTSVKAALPIPEQTSTHSAQTTKMQSASQTSVKKSENTSDNEPQPTQTNASSTTTELQSVSTTIATTQTTASSVSKNSATTVSTSAPVYVPSDNLPINSYTALNYDEVKGIWISYFELYPILTGKSKAQFESGIGEYYDNIKSLGLNTVYVHVRPYGDAIYDSDYFPWSKYCTGYIGEDPGFDPLEVMIEQAHKRNISFQAWVNPLRCYQEDDAPYVSDKYLTKQWYNNNDGDYIIKVNNYWYLNPAYDEVNELIALGVAEIVSKYNVDGVHIDDYFYPTTESYFDSIAFSKSGKSDLAQFRLDNCTKMVSAMYNAVKSHSKTALFGISTQGNVTNNKEVLYADVEKWCSEPGYCDYMAPQIYYGFENSGQPYSEVVEQWDDMLSGTGKELIPGLAVYKIGSEDSWAGSGKYEWINNTEIIKRQIEKARTANTYSGIILYSYQFVFTPDSSVSSAVNKEIAAFSPLLS